MADDLDITQDRMEAEEARRREAFTPVVIPKGTGVCQTEGCGEVLSHDGRWCGSDCRDAWQLDQKRRR